MPLPIERVNDLMKLSRDLARVKRDLAELRAARSLESSSIGTGGLTIQDPTRPERIVLTPQGALTVPVSYQPPAVEFYSGAPGEVTPGQVMAYATTAAFGQVPAAVLATGDLGSGFAYLEMQSGNALGDSPQMSVVLGGGGISVTATTMEITLSGPQFQLDANGANWVSESGGALTLNNGWTATGGTWQAPYMRRQIDNHVTVIGSITPGTLTSGTVIATLPGTHYPPADLEFRAPGGSATAYCDLVVHGASGVGPGTITITNVAGTVTRVSLSSIRFSLNP